jgi:hypothetical protein
VGPPSQQACALTRRYHGGGASFDRRPALFLSPTNAWHPLHRQTLGQRLPAAPQEEYLKRELGGSWGDRLMSKVQLFAAKCPPGSSHPECQFPVLAGSYLSHEDLGR